MKHKILGNAGAVDKSEEEKMVICSGRSEELLSVTAGTQGTLLWSIKMTN